MLADFLILNNKILQTVALDTVCRFLLIVICFDVLPGSHIKPLFEATYHIACVSEAAFFGGELLGLTCAQKSYCRLYANIGKIFVDGCSRIFFECRHKRCSPDSQMPRKLFRDYLFTVMLLEIA